MSIGQYVTNTVISFDTTALSFITSFYSIEYFFRKFFITKAFPDNKISTYPDILKLSLGTKIFIYFFSVSLYPISLYYFVSFHYSTKGMQNLFFLSGGIFFAFFFTGILLTFFLFQSINAPLQNMKLLADRIKVGNYSSEVKVISADTIGILSETLNDMSKELKEKEHIKDTFGKYVDPSVRDFLLTKDIQLGGNLIDSAILFTDIRGFTSLSEKYLPEQIVFLLNKYFTAIGNCIIEEGGLINKFIGDSVMAIFGVPIPLKNPAESAVLSAIKMRLALDQLNEELLNENLPILKNGIGIHYGKVLAGNIGMEARLEFTVIGDAVNMASRIESLCKDFQTDLLFSESVYDNLEDKRNTKFIAETNIRGKTNKVKLFTILTQSG